VDTSTPAGKLLFAIAGAFAQFERDLIRERVRSGVQNHIRKNGSWGPERKFDWADAVKLRTRGMSLRKIASALGVHRSSVQRALRGNK
jgi:DNA invertase Pin-like site-specific DNA recombinase